MDTKKFVLSKSKDIASWYNDIVLKAELADYAPVKGCMVIRPYGYAIWESIQTYLDKLIKDRGVKNAYFPMFIPEEFLNKEKEHVKGFSPELAVVTHAGGQELTDKLILRPTSETVMYHMYQKWVNSWRQLPILINQWCNVVRWEKRTYMFLRTTEFLWQEGHCAHLTHQESQDQVIWALEAYQKTYNNLLAMYGVAGVKSESEKFAGAGKSYTFEVLMPNGKALQACTSHDLGQNFAKAFNWTVQDQNGKNANPWQNSWGLSTRSIGGLIMVQSDDDGLILPPQIAPIQVVIIPIPGQPLDKYIKDVTAKLSGLRYEIDQLENETAGFKFNKWEVKGVPIRLEIGQKEADQNQVALYRRDTKQKQTISLDNLSSEIHKILDEIQTNLFNQHKKFTQENTHNVNSYDQFKKIMSTTKGFISALWCQDPDCEAQIKADTKATTRCLPLDSKKEKGVCVHCGKPASYRWLFGQSY